MTGSFTFGTKAGTLERLADLVPSALFCDQVVVPVLHWRRQRQIVTRSLADRFNGRRLAVRSSTTTEDTFENSNAGVFLSLTGVPVTGVAEAIDSVIASYDAQGSAHEVLIQPMVEDVALSGVVLTRDLNTGAPYYVINYDDYSGRTDTVTGGAMAKTVAVHRANPDALRSPRMRKIISVIKEIEAATNCSELDIEFCVTSEIEVYVLQVRPLAAQHRWPLIEDKTIDDAITAIRAELDRRMRPQEGLAGNTTIFGEMPDWNPAEMIGNTPRPLAISLYKTLITDSTWSNARARMGYRCVDLPLLIDFAGRPYIDVRLSLNSFLPSDLDDGLAERLVNHQLELLAEDHDLHDRIEFEVAITCRNLAFSEQAVGLREAGFSSDDVAQLEEGLRKITAGALAEGSTGLDRLTERTNGVLNPSMPSLPENDLGHVRRLLADTIELGTLPFSMLARHGFIAVSFLKSMVSQGVLTKGDADRFLGSVRTIATDVVAHMVRVMQGTMGRESFLKRYGHLRPGTYDIASWRYDERPDLYLAAGGPGETAAPQAASEPFSFDTTQERALGALLKAEGYEISPAQLLDYMATAIAAREQAKFAFTRGISDALQALCRWGEQRGFDRDDVSFLDIGSILEGDKSVEALRRQIAAGREANKLTHAIRLPHLIVEPDDIDIVRGVLGQPTFVTAKSVTAPTQLLRTNQVPALAGRIVLIKNADPGFDWMFSHDIAGLITKYGGANSHMAIRCAEFGLPAAIGCGVTLFEKLAAASVVELNCAARKVSGH